MAICRVEIWPALSKKLSWQARLLETNALFWNHGLRQGVLDLEGAAILLDSTPKQAERDPGSSSSSSSLCRVKGTGCVSLGEPRTWWSAVSPLVPAEYSAMPPHNFTWTRSIKLHLYGCSPLPVHAVLLTALWALPSWVQQPCIAAGVG